MGNSSQLPPKKIDTFRARQDVKAFYKFVYENGLRDQAYRLLIAYLENSGTLKVDEKVARYEDLIQ